MHRGTIATLVIAKDAVKGTRRHFKQKKQFKLEKARYRLQKAEYKLFKGEQYQPKLAKSRKELKEKKQIFGERKKFVYCSCCRTSISKAKKAVPNRIQNNQNCISETEKGKAVSGKDTQKAAANCRFKPYCTACLKACQLHGQTACSKRLAESSSCR